MVARPRYKTHRPKTVHRPHACTWGKKHWPYGTPNLHFPGVARFAIRSSSSKSTSTDASLLVLIRCAP
jgi:hypothetical protein